MSLATKAVTAWPALALLVLAALLPVYGPWFPTIEGALFPVTSKITIGETVAHDDGLLFRFSYESGGWKAKPLTASPSISSTDVTRIGSP